MTQVSNDKKLNIKKTNDDFRNGWTIPIVFLVFAIAFTAVMMYVIVLQSSRNKYYKDIEAEVVSVADYTDFDGDDHYEVYVRYFVDGEKYKQRLNYWEEGLKVGDFTTIRYDVRNPSIIKTTNEFTILIIIEVTMSIALYCVTTFLIIRKVRIDKKYNARMRGNVEEKISLPE